jgi:Ca2+-binding RTX toxin-like protein
MPVLSLGAGYDDFSALYTPYLDAEDPKSFLTSDPAEGAAFNAVLSEFARPLTLVKNTATQAIFSVDGYYFVIDGSGLSMTASGSGTFGDYGQHSTGTLSTMKVYQGGSVSNGTFSGGTLITTASLSSSAATLTVGGKQVVLDGAGLPTSLASVQALLDLNYTGTNISITDLKYLSGGSVVKTFTLPSSPLFSALNDYQDVARLITGKYGDAFKQDLTVLQLSTTQLAFSNSDGILLVQGTGLTYTGSYSSIDYKAIGGTITGAQFYLGGTYSSTTHTVSGGTVGLSATMSTTQVALTCGNIQMVFDGTGLPTSWGTWLSILDGSYSGSALGVKDFKILKDGQEALAISLTATELDVSALGYKLAFSGTFDTSVLASVIQGTAKPNMSITGVTVTKIAGGATVLSLTGLTNPISVFSGNKLSLDELFSTITGINASTATTGLTLDVSAFPNAATITGGSGNDTIKANFQDRTDALSAGPASNGTYTISGGANTLYTLTNIENVSITGGEGNDTLVGGTGNDSLDGHGGNNVLYGGAGNDTLVSHGSGDWLGGDAGDDTLIFWNCSASQPVVSDGGAGNDTAVVKYISADGITGSFINGNYIIATGSSSVATLLNVENVQVTGTSSSDTLSGGAGNDVLDGGYSGADVLNGGGGNDTLRINADLNTDTVDGGAGTDTLVVNLANLQWAQNVSSVLYTTFSPSGGVTAYLNYTNNGVPTYGSKVLVNFSNIENFEITGTGTSDYFTAGQGNYVFNGGGGYDSVGFAGATGGVTVNLNLTGAQSVGGGLGTVKLSSVENVTGTAYDDTLIGDGASNYFSPGAGNDSVDGGAGTTDAVIYTSATSAVTVNLGLTGAQAIGGGQGSDALVNIEGVLGSSYNDTLTGNASDNFFRGGAGDDSINGGAGSDTVYYDDASSGVTVNLSVTTGQSVGGGRGVDTLSGIENIIGSSYDDTLTGDSGNNTLTGGAGNDSLNGGAGSDTASYANSGAGVTVSLAITGAQSVGAGLGTDTLTNIENLIGSSSSDTLTGDGNDNVIDAGGGYGDKLFGGAGNDTLIGGDYATTFDGGAGNDLFQGHGDRGNWASYANATGGVTVNLGLSGGQSVGGGMGTDTLLGITSLIGSSFNDVLTGDSANNQLQGNAGDDTLSGGGGADYLAGGAGNDSLDGGDGNDQLYAGDPNSAGGSSGTDILNGGAGDDTLYLGLGSATANGGTGSDTANYSAATGGVRVNLSLTGSQSVGGGMGTNTLTSVENLTGSNYNDTLTGDAGNNSINGGNGDDSLNGGAGNDYLLDWSGTNTLVGGDGDDTLLSWGGTNTLSGGIGNDVFELSADKSTADGGDGNDTFKVRNGSNTVTGGAGDDTFIVTEHWFADVTSIDGGTGNDTVVLDGDYYTGSGPNAPANWVGLADTTFTNIETIRLTAGHRYDLVTANGTVAAGQSLTIDGSALGSSDGLTFSGTAETDGRFNIIGGADDDWIRGGAGADTINGGAGNDFIKANGDDVIDGGTGWNRVGFSGAAHGVTVDLRLQGSVQDTTVGRMTLTNIQDLSGTTYADTLTGDSGDNWLWGTGGDDVLSGGAGNDILAVGPTGTQTVDGGTGVNTLSFYDSWSSEEAGVTFDLSASGAHTIGTGSVVVTNIQNLMGTQKADSLTGDANDNALYGSDGADTLSGGAGNDVLYGDSAYRAWDNDGGLDGPRTKIDSTQGDGAGNDSLIGGAGNDSLYGGDCQDTLQGGAGNDLIDGGNGLDWAAYADATGGVTVSLAVSGAQTVGGGSGVDTLVSIENLMGSAYADTLTGDANDNVLNGGAGNDVLDPGTGKNTVIGGDGTDTLVLALAPASYTVKKNDDGSYLVQDTAGNTNTLVDVEQVRFAATGQTLSLADFQTQSFDPLRYIASYPDLIVSCGDNAQYGLQHYINNGAAEGRKITFDPVAYLCANPGLIAVFGTNLTAATEHYIKNGYWEGRKTTFDAYGYLCANPDLIGVFGTDTAAAEMHYVKNGYWEGRKTAFDAVGYLCANPGLIAAFGTDTAAAEMHYVKNGYWEGRKTAFDAVGYLCANTDLIGAFGTDTAAAEMHYLKNGYWEGRKVAFDALAYVCSYNDLLVAFRDDKAAAEKHYLNNGYWEGRKVTFDPLAYLCSYTDLIGAFGNDKVAAEEHYIRNGYWEGRKITFDALNYIASYNDLIITFHEDKTAAEEHYLRNGYWEGRKVTFDPVAYLINNTDLGSCGFTASDATLHYLRNGYWEHRTANGSFGSDQTSHDLVIGGNVSDTIGVAGDKDWFGVSLIAGQSYIFSLRGVDGGGGTLADPFLSLYDAHGLLVTSNNDGKGHDSQIAFTATATGSFYLAASANNTGTGTYKLFAATD